MKMLKYVTCFIFDLKIYNNKVYNYIVESFTYLLVPSGSFPYFLKSLSFPSSTRNFHHSLVGIIKCHSYLRFLSRWTLYWSQTIFICCPTFFRNFIVSKVPLPKRPTNRLVSSSFKYFVCLSHLVQMVGSKISKVKSFIFL